MSTGTWTVVGYFYDNGAAFADWAEAPTAFDAMVRVAQERSSDELVIVGAIRGRHDMDLPSEDGFSTAFAVDMAQQEEDAEGGE